jgi:hypothetical protein
MVIIVAIGGVLAIWVATGGMVIAAVRRTSRSQRGLQATVNTGARGIAAFEKGRLVARNKQFLELLRVAPEFGEIGLPAAQLGQAESGGLLTDLTQQLNLARETNQSFMIERNRLGGGILQLYYHPPLDGIAVFCVEEVTRQHQSELYLQNGQKLDESDHEMGDIAHDFNNLLTVVLMNLDAMRNDPVVMEKFGRRIEIMSDASHQGIALVRQLPTADMVKDCLHRNKLAQC